MRKLKGINFKRSFKVITLFLTIALAAGAFSVTAGAKTTYGGLEAEILSNKVTYSADERIGLGVKVRNGNNFSVNNVRITVTIPNGLALVSGETVKNVPALSASGETELLFVVQKSDTITPTPTPTSTPYNSSGSAGQTYTSENVSLSNLNSEANTAGTLSENENTIIIRSESDSGEQQIAVNTPAGENLQQNSSSESANTGVNTNERDLNTSESSKTASNDSLVYYLSI